MTWHSHSLRSIFDNHYIAPHAVELAVLLVHAHFTEAEFVHERATGGILDEHARDQFPEAACSGFISSACIATRPAPCRAITLDVDRELGDACVTLARPIRRRRREGNYVVLSSRPPRSDEIIKPRHAHRRRCAGAFQSRNAIVNALIVNRRNRGCIVELWPRRVCIDSAFHQSQRTARTDTAHRAGRARLRDDTARRTRARQRRASLPRSCR